MEFPFDAQVVANTVANPSVECLASAKTLQGGATVSYHFDPSVESVQVLLKSEGMPLNARIELIQGPDNNREVIELYTDDGSDRPFFCFLETPGYGSVVRILNTGPIAFPITASVVPHAVLRPGAYRSAHVGGDVVVGGMDPEANRTPRMQRPLLQLLLALAAGGARGQLVPPSPPVLIISPPSMSEEELRARHVKHVNLTLTGFTLILEREERAWAPRLGIDLGATAEWLAREVVGSAEQPHSWLATVAPYLSPEHVERVSNSMLRLHLVGIDGTGWYPAFDVRFTDAVSIGAPFWATENNLTANPPYANLTLDVSVPRVSVLSNLVGGFVSVSELRARSHSLQLVLSG
ncbi:hypothetical protein Ctob_014112, partial [Chrysochromulina tobinii]